MTDSAFTVAGTATSTSSGTVTSVGIISNNPAALSVIGSPITTSGNIALTTVGNFLGYQIFTMSGTWTKPSGCNSILALGVGGGGGGGSAGFFNTGGLAVGGGGGGGAYCQKLINVSAVSSVAVTIGGGGSGGVTYNIPAGNGGDTTFGAYFTAGGGVGSIGSAQSSGNNQVPGGAGGAASGGDINIPGNPGFWGSSFASGVFNGASGYGATSLFGAITIGQYYNTDGGVGANAVGYGSGGSGACTSQGAAQGYTGGNGAPGIVIVYQYA